MSETQNLQTLNSQIELTSEDYSNEKLRQALEAHPKTTVLKLNSNLKPTIILQIKSAPLLQLVTLNLAFNNITTIEPLQHIALPSLKELHLFHNHISSLRGLKKCYMPRLQFLSVVNNSLVSLEHLPVCNLPSLKALMAYDNNILTITGLLKTQGNIQHLVLSDFIQQDWVSRTLLNWRFVECYIPQ